MIFNLFNRFNRFVVHKTAPSTEFPLIVYVLGDTEYMEVV